jgi:hypothetical protein
LPSLLAPCEAAGTVRPAAIASLGLDTDGSGIVVAAGGGAELPVIVDGGVTEEVAPLCVTAGVESMVVGRALLAPAKGSVK